MTVNSILLLFTLGISFYAWNNQDVMSKLILDSYSITKNKEYFKFITSGFIHADYMHLFFNLIALNGFGQMSEYIFTAYYGRSGLVFYALFYLVAIIVANIPSYLKNKTNYNYASLGASGGVSALIGIVIIFAPFENVSLFFFFPIPSVIFGIAYIVYSYYMGKMKYDNINHDAHLYGLLFGIIGTGIMFPNLIINFFNQVQDKLGLL